MPHPIVAGRFLREIPMQAKQVYKYDCNRCGRTWYEDKQVPAGKLVLEMQRSSGEVIKGDFDTLCPTCEETVANYVKSILKVLEKLSSRKSGAKKGEPESSSPPELGSTVPRENAANTPAVARPLPRSSPSRPQ